MTKYGFEFSKEVLAIDKKRLINQLWKVLPMREKEEDWQKQLQTVTNEVVGLHEIFIKRVDFLILLCKLESLPKIKDFPAFRKNIFEAINLLGELLDE